MTRGLLVAHVPADKTHRARVATLAERLRERLQIEGSPPPLITTYAGRPRDLPAEAATTFEERSRQAQVEEHRGEDLTPDGVGTTKTDGSAAAQDRAGAIGDLASGPG